ncbi:hypothetical protein FRB90_006918, partial [Tulasnella sp. 427]
MSDVPPSPPTPPSVDASHLLIPGVSHFPRAYHSLNRNTQFQPRSPHGLSQTNDSVVPRNYLQTRPPPTRQSTLELAPELDKRYLTIEEHPFASGAFSDVFPGRWESPNDGRYPDGVNVAIKVFRLGGVVGDPNYATNYERCGK